MTLSKEDLSRLVTAGAVADIFKGERAYAVLKVIGENASAINGSARNWGELFGVLQAHAQTEALLAVSRLYDRPDRRHATQCLQDLLEKLEQMAERLPPIVEKYNLTRELTRQGMRVEDVALVDSACDADVTRAMTAFLRNRLQRPKVVESIKRVKAIRDKRIAHNEACAIEGPNWDSVLTLLTLAQEIVGLIGWAYTGTVYLHDGRYLLSSDAQRSGAALRRVLKALEVVGEQPPRHRAV